MASRSIATLSLSFGLVSIPVKLYSATESSSAIRFKLMSSGGARVRQQFVTEEPSPASASLVNEIEEARPPPPERIGTKSRGASSRVFDFPTARQAIAASEIARPFGPAVIDRAEMVKGYEFEKGKFVLFTADELKALEQGSRQTIDIIAFIPDRSVDPIYFDKAYFLAPDKRGAKPYSLLLRAMQETGRCALAKWAFRSKEYVVQIRASEGGMVLQQLLYAEEVRSLADLDIDLVPVGDAELKLARQLIEQISADAYDPTQFVDEERKRILAAVEKKIEGRQIVAPEHQDAPAGAQVLDLGAALRASLKQVPAPVAAKERPARSSTSQVGERKPVKRAQPRAGGASASTGQRAGKR